MANGSDTHRSATAEIDHLRTLVVEVWAHVPPEEAEYVAEHDPELVREIEALRGSAEFVAKAAANPAIQRLMARERKPMHTSVEEFKRIAGIED